MIGTGVSIWQAVEAVASKEDAVASKEEAVASKEIAEQQRSRAQVSLGKALEAVDKMLTRVGDETLKNVPLMDKVRRELLRDALELCRALLQENNEDPAVRHAVGNAYRRMGNVHEMLGDHAAAAEAFQQAIAILDPLAAGFPLRPAYRSDLSVSHRSLGNIYQTAKKRGRRLAVDLLIHDALAIGQPSRGS